MIGPIRRRSNGWAERGDEILRQSGEYMPPRRRRGHIDGVHNHDAVAVEPEPVQGPTCSICGVALRAPTPVAPRTEAGRRFIEKLRRDDAGFTQLTSGRFHLGAIVTDAEDAVAAIEREAAAPSAKALREALEWIATRADRRADGTYNYDRDALRQKARDALARLATPDTDR